MSIEFNWSILWLIVGIAIGVVYMKYFGKK
jgi:hypothetical protein